MMSVIMEKRKQQPHGGKKENTFLLLYVIKCVGKGHGF
jgi:hypothetical protein